MEEKRPTLEELPETRHSRLDRIGTLFKRKQKRLDAPEAPPPLIVEELAAFAETAEATAKPDAKVEVSIEQVPELEPDEVRQELEKVYEEVETDTEEEAPSELDYEKRAEIKHEPEPTAADQRLAQAMNKILTDLKEKTAAAHAAFSQAMSKSKGLNLPGLPRPAILAGLPALYQRAVLVGFGGGVVMLLMIVVLF